jgi:peroxiredoxin
MQINIGDRAPEFTLYNTKNEKVSLSDFKNQNTLILFFPLAFTGVCTTELCDTRDNMKKYESLDTNILAISVDSVFTLDKFKSEQKLNFPLLSDFNKEVSRIYGALYENWILDMKGVSKRSAFIVDKKGIIRYAEVLENAGDLPNFARIFETLDGLQ